MTQVKTHYVAKSGNRKTGVMAVTYRERESCPSTCPLLEKGCYAAGRLEAIATKHGSSDFAWADRAIAETPQGSAFRHLVVGDLLDAAGRLDQSFCGGIERVVAERPDIVLHILYSHAWEQDDVRDWILRMFADHGVVINASCQTEPEAARASALGMHPVIVASGEGDPLLGSKIDARRVVVCPAQTHGRTCAECGLCGKGDRGAWKRPVIAFLPHGSGKKAAAATAAR